MSFFLTVILIWIVVAFVYSVAQKETIHRLVVMLGELLKETEQNNEYGYAENKLRSILDNHHFSDSEKEDVIDLARKISFTDRDTEILDSLLIKLKSHAKYQNR